jgi:hypothetical protein
MTKRFTFAGLLGAAPKATRATAAESDEDKAMEEDEEEETVATDAAAETEEEEPAAEQTDEEETPAARRAFRRGRIAERARIGAILDKATTGNVGLAAQLACSTDLTVAQAAAVLAAAPVADAGSRLAAAMKGRDPAPLATAAAPEAADLPPELKAAQARMLAMKKKGA